jgi:L,D-peptidoglycan transpeptidase YkuD (ErfK/YbiS/YcfS/YnhG family)
MTYFRNFNHTRGFVALAALALASALPALRPAEAVPNYDGLWSVVIVTEQGLCDRAYRAPIRITKGTLANAGSGAFTITGKVGKNGVVTVMVSQGDKSATGTGRLSGNTGTGSWSGGPCAGTWQAERRS